MARGSVFALRTEMKQFGRVPTTADVAVYGAQSPEPKAEPADFTIHQSRLSKSRLASSLACEQTGF